MVGSVSGLARFMGQESVSASDRFRGQDRKVVPGGSGRSVEGRFERFGCRVGSFGGRFGEPVGSGRSAEGRFERFGCRLGSFGGRFGEPVG